MKRILIITHKILIIFALVLAIANIYVGFRYTFPSNALVGGMLIVVFLYELRDYIIDYIKEKRRNKSGDEGET
jgi:uncharacterized membrane protein (DUF373 family)